MIIEEIIFNNFRCFFGEQSSQLASDDGSHLTVVHAQNGSGKTSLLNCVMWTFYGVTTAGFDQITGSIANDEHLASGGTEAWVEILFKLTKAVIALGDFSIKQSHQKSSPQISRFGA